MERGNFYFEDVDLERILDDMARWYNVNIFI
ncbi:MAG: FecR domain-containing protein [Butyricimonas faecalis]